MLRVGVVENEICGDLQRCAGGGKEEQFKYVAASLLFTKSRVCVRARSQVVTLYGWKARAHSRAAHAS